MAAGLPSSILERHVAAALEGKHWDEAEGRSRIIVCVSRCSRGRVRDERNLSAKYLIDRLVDAGAIPEDDDKTILEVLNQAHAKDPKEVGTLVTIIWPV